MYAKETSPYTETLHHVKDYSLLKTWTINQRLIDESIVKRSSHKACFSHQGHVVHNWKVRWFVLKAEQLLYYRFEGGKQDSCHRGSVPLRGCEVTCPYLEYENRPVRQSDYADMLLRVIV